jgi:hypothetical protein
LSIAFCKSSKFNGNAKNIPPLFFSVHHPSTDNGGYQPLYVNI